MLMNMKDILAVAKENRFALPAFNIKIGRASCRERVSS